MKKVPASEYMKYDKYIEDEIDLPIKHESKPYLMIPLPDNATNLDVLKAVFPQIEVVTTEHSTCYDIYKLDYEGVSTSLLKRWCDAPYKAESEDKG